MVHHALAACGNQTEGTARDRPLSIPARTAWRCRSGATTWVKEGGRPRGWAKAWPRSP